MLVGKRPGPSIMRRTRSMSGGMAVDMQEATTEAISNNLEAHHEEAMPLPNSRHPHQYQHHEEDGIKDDPHADVVMGTQAEQTKYVFGTKGYELYDERLVGTDTVMFPSPTTTTTITDNHHSQNQTNNVNQAQAHAHLIPTPHFLRTCGLCRCHLATGRDIYMYRGDTAFCSLECREKQMKQDQKKEKWKVASNSSKQYHRVSPPTATAHASTKAQTAAAST